MNKSVPLQGKLVLLCAVVLGSHAFAQPTKLSISLSKPTILPGEEVHVVVDSSQPSTYCGIHVEYPGTTEPPTLIRIGHEGSKFPYTFTRAFNAPGTVQLKASGQRVSSALGCAGKGEATLVVAAPPVQANPTSDLRTQANRGDLDAMFGLGNTLANAGNDAEAVKWFTNASIRQHIKSMNALGYMYEAGRGVIQDHSEAAEWYRKAMMRGNPDAMVNRGVLLSKGLGLKEDKSQAYVHFSLGVAYANDPDLRTEATKLRDEMAKQLTAQQTNAAQAEAKKLATQIQK